MSDNDKRDHLGDGVYVYWNGYAVEISVNDHRNPPRVTLELEIIERLITFVKRMQQT